MKKFLALILCLVMMTALASCGNNSQLGTSNDVQSSPSGAPGRGSAENTPSETVYDTEVVLKWGIASSANSGPTEADAKAMELIEERSNGMITFEYYADGVLGDSPALLEQVLDGNLDICGCGIAEVDSYTTTLDILDLPFLVGENEATILFSEQWQTLIDQASEELGANIVATHGFGSRDFITTKTPVYTMSDLTGMNIRAVSTDMIVEAMKLLGANPVAVAFTELYTALSSGMVDGIENNITTMNALGMLDTVKYCTRVAFYPYVALDVINADLEDTLPDGYYDLIVECINEAALWWAEEGCAAWEQESLDAATEAGVEIIEMEDTAMQEIRDAMSPLYDEYAAKSDTYADFIEYCQSLG